MGNYQHIDTNEKMTAFTERLAGREGNTIAVDLEGEFNLHVYGERFCLLQVYDGHEQVVIDPYTVSINLIKTLLEDRNLLKITYDCTSDRALLFKNHRIRMNSILDLRPAVELLDFDRQDLKSVLDVALGVQGEGNKKQFQQYDWTRRPIRESAIEYALQDVRYLFGLKDALLRRLADTGLMEAFILENLKRQDRDPDINRKPGLFRSGRHNRLGRDGQKTFKRLYDIRERFAKEMDLPPNTVMLNNDLFAIVTGKMNVSEIRGNRRMPEDVMRALRAELEETLAQKE